MDHAADCCRRNSRRAWHVHDLCFQGLFVPLGRSFGLCQLPYHDPVSPLVDAQFSCDVGQIATIAMSRTKILPGNIFLKPKMVCIIRMFLRCAANRWPFGHELRAIRWLWTIVSVVIASWTRILWKRVWLLMLRRQSMEWVKLAGIVTAMCRMVQ